MNQKIITLLSQKLNIKNQQVQIVLDLLSQGSSIPFISRYRKDATGGLNEEQVFEIQKLYKYNQELQERKKTILDILKEKELLTEQLQETILKTTTKSNLEAIYEPFKVGKITKATEAIALGLQPLAQTILNNKNPKFNVFIEAKKYFNEKVTNVKFAIQQANFIIAQIISQDVKVREFVKESIYKYATLQTKQKKKVEDLNENFSNYYDFNKPIKFIKNHNILAINRGIKLNILSLNFNYNIQPLINTILYQYDHKKINIKNLILPVEDSLKRLILPSIEREIFNELFDKAQHSAIEVFATSLEKLLKAPATYGHTILAIDPAFVSGCKLAVLNSNSEVLFIDKIFPNAPLFKIIQAQTTLIKIFQKFPEIDIIVIGNGTASRETELFIADFIQKQKLNVKWAIVSEVGASVYSTSKIAQEEFPNLSVEERSAVNIGRKFLDPLNELVKINPKSIGVGQYQHDVNQRELEEKLKYKVDKVVNETGVDLNSATKSILTYVSGLNNKIVEKILEYRKLVGNFTNRNELKKVKGLGEKTFEQSIGFLRIFNSENFLDKTFIHPESYQLANYIIAKYHFQPKETGIKISETIKKELFNEFSDKKYEIELILNALENPIKNFDKNKSGFLIKDKILEIQDLQPGFKLQGTIENITDFGLFVYIGLKKHLFIHLNDAKLENQSIFEKYYVGMIIDLEILNIDSNRNRINGKVI